MASSQDGQSVNNDAIVLYGVPAGCGNLACSAQTPSSALRFCSACKLIRYCSDSCSYENWKNHRNECKEWTVAREKMKRSTLYGKCKDDTLFNELQCFMGQLMFHLDPEMIVIARSALLVGSPDSLVNSHLISLNVDYVTPRGPVDIDNKSAVRKLFKFKDCEVICDEEAPEDIKRHVESARAQFRQMMIEDKKSAVYTNSFIVLLRCKNLFSFRPCRFEPISDANPYFQMSPNPAWKNLLEKFIDCEDVSPSLSVRLLECQLEDAAGLDYPKVTAVFRKMHEQAVALYIEQGVNDDALDAEMLRIEAESGPEAAQDYFKEFMSTKGWKVIHTTPEELMEKFSQK